MKGKLRYLAAATVAYLLIKFGFTRRIEKRAMNGEVILSIYFHAPSKELFEFCIQWLKRRNYIFLSQHDILSIANKRKPFPSQGVIITIDDGWATNEDNIVTVAEKYEVPITIFIATDPIESGNYWWRYVKLANKLNLLKLTVKSLKCLYNKDRNRIVEDIKRMVKLPREAMTVGQVKRIAKYECITIGSHTVTHPILINCENNECFFELKESKVKIENWIDKKLSCFAYPNGDYSKREIMYLKNIGYKSAYSTRNDYLTKDNIHNLYELPRFCIFENISKSEAICRMLGIWQKFI